jgi:hypothetical protein
MALARAIAVLALPFSTAGPARMEMSHCVFVDLGTLPNGEPMSTVSSSYVPVAIGIDVHADAELRLEG